MNISGPILSNAELLIPPSNVLPIGVWKSFTIINNIHWYWRLYRRGERLVKKNVYQTIAEKAFNFWLKDFIVYQVASQFVLGVNRIVECVNGYMAVCISYQKLRAEWNNDYPLCEKPNWDVTFNWISPSRYYGCKIFLTKNIQYVERVTKRFFDLAKALFQLSMLTLDAMDSFYCSPSTKQEAGEDFLENTEKLMQMLSNQAESLIDQIENNKKWVDYILIEGRAGFTAENMVDILKKLSRCPSGWPVIKPIGMMISGLAITILGDSVVDQLPEWTIPRDSPPASPTKAKGRAEQYIPEHKITLLDKKTTFKVSTEETYLEKLSNFFF